VSRFLHKRKAGRVVFGGGCGYLLIKSCPWDVDFDYFCLLIKRLYMDVSCGYVLLSRSDFRLERSRKC
jgi:hypothetical protein